MITEVKVRLAGFGYEVTVEDKPYLLYATEKAKNRVKNNINRDYIPDGLFYVTVDIAAGYFLQEKIATDPDSLEGFDLSAAVKSIKEGDTDISFGVGEGSLTPEQRLNNLINHLITGGESEFVTYRRMVW